MKTDLEPATREEAREKWKQTKTLLSENLKQKIKAKGVTWGKFGNFHYVRIDEVKIRFYRDRDGNVIASI